MTDEQTVVGGRYVLGELLGRGGMAEVHRAFDQRLGRAVAVKRMSATLAADPTAQIRFRREAHAAASLNHPAVAAVFDTGTDVDPASGATIPYLVMELVEGRTLRAVLRDGPPLSPERCLEVTSQVLAALAHSHTAGIVHRDIKPANVMLTPTGDVKVMDFGIARAADDSTTSLTQTAGVIGTAQYLSPEQARGAHVDQRSDIYSTGCLLYELLLGRPLFVGDSSVSLAYQHVNEDPVPPREHDPRLSPAVDAVVLRALVKDPAGRYQTADEMRADIDRLLSTRQVRAQVGAGLAGAAAAAAAGAATAVAATRPLDDGPTAVVARMGTGSPLPPVPPPPMVVPGDGERTDREDEQPARRSRAGRVAVVALVLLLLAGLGVALVPRLLGPGAGTAGQVSVPDVLGRTRAEADAAIRQADLVPRFTNVKGKDDDTVDTVVGVKPVVGTEVAPGTSITLQVNVGPEVGKIPGGLVGEDAADAKQTLADAGFSNVTTRPAARQPAGAKAGEVVSVDPKEGSVQALDDRVVLLVARAASRPTAGSRPTSDPEPTATSKSGGSSAPPTSEPTTAPPTSSSTTGAAPSSKPTASKPTASKATKAAKPTKTDKPVEPGARSSTSTAPGGGATAAPANDPG